MRFALALLLLAGSAADAAEPPDVLHGERYDGRPPLPQTRQYLLMVPRLVLAVPRVLMRGVGAAAKPVMEWWERNQVQQRINDALTSEDGLIGVRPVIHFELSFRASFGLSYFTNRLPHGRRLVVSTAVGGLDIVLQDLRLKLPFAQGKASLDIALSYHRRSDHLFTGIGTATALGFGRYGVDRGDLVVTVSLQPRRPLHIELGAELGVRRYNEGRAYAGVPSVAEVYCERTADGRCLSGRVDEHLMPGFTAGTEFVRVHAALSVDSRKDETQSGVVAAAAAWYTQDLTDDASYLRLRAHLGGSIEIWRRRSIYIGVTAVDQLSFGNSPVPFTELVRLGGPDDLRGFLRDRFRDSASLIGTLEYRWPILRWMDAAVFTDYGGVFKSNFQDFTFDNMRVDLGLGVSVHSRKKYVVRIQAAYGFGDDGGFRLVIAGNGNPS